jgi:hypothetical protein
MPRLPRLKGLDQLCVEIIGVDLMEADPRTPVVSHLDFYEPFRGVSYLN